MLQVGNTPSPFANHIALPCWRFAAGMGRGLDPENIHIWADRISTVTVVGTPPFIGKLLVETSCEA